MLTRRTWRQDLTGLYAWPYLNSCDRPEEFEYCSFLTWMKKENLGKAKARAEWKNAIAQMERSNLQILKETATRLNKAWTKDLDKDFEDEHFRNRITKRKLENNRHTLHQAVDSVLTKRSRLEYREEEDILDSALSSENHHTPDEVEQGEQEDQCEQDEQGEQEDHDEGTDQEQLNKFELEELRANLSEVTHIECNWKAQEKCVACLFKLYQGDCIDALESGELRKKEIADTMALIGVFAPHIPTPRMLRVFGSALDDVMTPVRLPVPDINDSAIMAAVRHCINGDPDEASEALRPLHRKMRIMIESLMDKLPHKADMTLAEETFTTDYVSPIIHGILGIDNKNVAIHFPNTESKLQKCQGIKPDRPDVIVKVRGHEVFFGEVTGPTRASDTSKCAWDTFRLARFAKSFLEDGNSVAPIIQVIYTSGSYLRLHVKARGMFLLEEVGYFEVPSSISRIPSLTATLPTLLVAQDDLKKVLQSDLNEYRRRSWGFKDIPNLKRRVVA